MIMLERSIGIGMEEIVIWMRVMWERGVEEREGELTRCATWNSPIVCM